jgi:hypothetical protein
LGIFSSGKRGTRVTRDYSKKLVKKERKLTLQNRKKSGKQHGEAGKPYEEAVREKTFGKSEVINGREIDSVTNDVLIQAKDSESAVNKPHNFLNKKTRTQIKETINMAKQKNKSAEFWFKKDPHPEVKKYIEDKGGKVVLWEPTE